MKGSLVANTTEKQLNFKCLPKQVSLKDFNRHIIGEPIITCTHLSRPLPVRAHTTAQIGKFVL